jgi:hypothetical protein
MSEASNIKTLPSLLFLALAFSGVGSRSWDFLTSFAREAGQDGVCKKD